MLIEYDGGIVVVAEREEETGGDFSVVGVDIPSIRREEVYGTHNVPVNSDGVKHSHSVRSVGVSSLARGTDYSYV